MIVLCAIHAEPGCRERRHEGICGCRPRWLPECILERATPHGCPVWREGKTCSCERLYMPRCLVTGCEERRKGRRCECPRTPTEMCPHVLAKLKQFGSLNPDAANRMANAWAEQLWSMLPVQYADRPLASAGCTARAGENAVALMAVRQSLGLSLWHPDDDRYPAGAVLQRQAAGLQRLLGAFAAVKGGAA